MPDAHAGKGMPIGGVLATNGVIVPNAVGVDIGCGMCAIKTNLKAEDFSYTDLTSIMSKIRAVVPLGFDHQNKKQASLQSRILAEAIPDPAFYSDDCSQCCGSGYRLWYVCD